MTQWRIWEVVIGSGGEINARNRRGCEREEMIFEPRILPGAVGEES